MRAVRFGAIVWIAVFLLGLAANEGAGDVIKFKRVLSRIRG